MDEMDVEKALRRIQDLPTLPTLLIRIIETINDPDSSALDLGQHIAADQSLSATLLRIVNSAYYGFYRQINSITTAIVILGFNEVRNLAMLAKAFQVIPESGSGYERQQLWRHSLAAAITADRIGKTKHLDSAGGLFVGGLLHDLGKVALDILFPDKYLSAAREAHLQRTSILDIERQWFPLDHTQVGGLLAEHWNMPAEVAEAMACHHEPETAKAAPEFTHAVAVANFITYQAGLGEASNGCTTPLPEASTAALRISADDIAKYTQELQQACDRIDELLGAVAAA